MRANDRQVGGDHYRGHDVQHWDYAWMKRFDPFQYQITKYVERWRKKNGVQDLRKALHFLEKYIELAEAEVKADEIKQQTIGGKTMEEWIDAAEYSMREQAQSMRNEDDRRTETLNAAVDMLFNSVLAAPACPECDDKCRWCLFPVGAGHAVGCPGTPGGPAISDPPAPTQGGPVP